MAKLCSHDECTGCLACVNVRCASLLCETDQEGFIRPVVQESCTNCGRCSKVCPKLVVKRASNDYKARYYACAAKDQDVLMRSSSGGLFSLLARQVLKKKGIVYGAAFNENMHLEHIAVDTEDKLPLLCGSKYLQSDIDGCYFQIQKLLQEGRTVLFCGLPCQVDGLNCYLETDNFERLITVDILCKGVPSPGVFSAFIAQQEKNVGRKIVNVTFRDKSSGWGNAIMGIYLSNGIVIKHPLTQTTFGAAFSTNLIMRKSCYQCSYRSMHRVGDITLGDFWGIGKDSNLYEAREKGVSFLSINTSKGEERFSEIGASINYESADISNAISNNSALRTSYYSNKKREDFFNKFTINPQKALAHYTVAHRMLVFLRNSLKGFNRV
ncbi:Coenzyme F420-reducing hydrogenase, beta subunit [Syntrophus gentianae]|uniref:Coenzyme F420-reducing hydrogenase, beta subunit n=1 Tax=Syntrophus gentianae TaxID=43775 RepID=A0A1H7V6X5_9BACT|nr:Coenzyme F420 hydrogenase/dehydrogenase, beta subunit C-terminal domain [Syntrophus gentianae]SEM04953.1 Coenzyme F420-reducing hydrogenase, beta subunit [Syntrophus gentianae]